MRSVLVLVVLALTVAPLAAAQIPDVAGGATVQMSGLGAAVHTNGNQATHAIAVSLVIDQGTCVLAGGTATINVEATGKNNESVEVLGSPFGITISSMEGMSGATIGPVTATLVVEPTHLVGNSTVEVDVRATGTVGCSASGAGFGSYDAEEATGNQTFTFAPLAGTGTTAPAEQPLPGFELVLLVAALAAAAIVLRRKA